MHRRGLTLLLATLLALGLTGSAAFAHVPYVALGPGPAYDALGNVDGTPVVTISGRRTYPTTGELDLTTVGVEAELTLGQALRDWFDRDLAVVPRDLVYSPGVSDAQVDQQNSQAMTASQDSATSAALRQLGIAFEEDVVVGSVRSGAPASGTLQPGDVVRTVDGAAVSDSKALADEVSARSPGDPVTLTYERAGASRTATLRTQASSDRGQPVRAIIGVAAQDRAHYPFEVTIRLKDVGGPSAGLMFALAVVDKLDQQPLTGGLHVAGTGEISPDGTVGPIGGITQKLLGARRKGATVFLTPAANCKEALGAVPAGLTLVRVATLREALQGLRVVRDGGTPRGCADGQAA